MLISVGLWVKYPSINLNLKTKWRSLLTNISQKVHCDKFKCRIVEQKLLGITIIKSIRCYLFPMLLLYWTKPLPRQIHLIKWQDEVLITPSVYCLFPLRKPIIFQLTPCTMKSQQSLTDELWTAQDVLCTLKLLANDPPQSRCFRRVFSYVKQCCVCYFPCLKVLSALPV